MGKFVDICLQNWNKRVSAKSKSCYSFLYREDPSHVLMSGSEGGLRVRCYIHLGDYQRPYIIETMHSYTLPM